jgi:hypothetical protein
MSGLSLFSHFYPVDLENKFQTTGFVTATIKQNHRQAKFS